MRKHGLRLFDPALPRDRRDRNPALSQDRFHFKLQGSYRNMNKLAEKVVAAMTEEEPAVRVASQLATLGVELASLRDAVEAAAQRPAEAEKTDFAPYRQKLSEAMKALAERAPPAPAVPPGLRRR